MKNMITVSILLLMPIFLVGQSINSFDAASEEGYWQYEISDNADTLLSYVNVNYVTDPVTEGSGAIQLEYSAHNSEAWGGYAKIYHMYKTEDEGTTSPIEGTWMMAQQEGALKVGPAPGDGSWWSSSVDDLTLRACYFDDEYVFGADGTFENVLGADTWLEAWQGVESDQCGAPVAPHDGSNPATWEFDGGTGAVTLSGLGAYLGLPKAVNGGELPSVEVPETRTYLATIEDDVMTLSIETGTGVFWTFTLSKLSDSPIAGTWMMAQQEGALKVGPAPGDGSWWSSSVDDLTLRACYFDDEYVFGADGTFENVLGADTWLEAWQGVESDQCGAPVAPHDGSNPATWEYNGGTGSVTLSGLGAFLGLPKAVNGGELPGVEVPETRTYLATIEGDVMTLTIETGTGVFWTFTLEKTSAFLAAEEDNSDIWNSLFEMRPEDNQLWDWSGYDSISFSYYNAVPQSAEGRVHLRLNLSDYGNVADPANYYGLGEYYYSFHYILDDAPGWNTITMPLVRNDDWGGGGFNLTGWVGDAGNGELDLDAIAGFHFEFSVSGGGDGDFVNGTIVLDNFTLTGSLNAITAFPGFEGGGDVESGVPTGWGGWQSAWDGWGSLSHIATPLVDDAHSGDYYLELGVDAGNGYAVVWPEATGDIVAAPGETWELGAWIKDISPAPAGGDFAALKIEAYDAEENKIFEQEEIVPVTTEWGYYTSSAVMPDNTVKVQAVLVATKWLDDGIAAVYAFDDVWMQCMGVLDVVPPVAVSNVSAVPAQYYNLVTWSDNAGEEGETYDVYASTEPITDLTDSSVDVVATNVLEGTQAVVHYLFHPLEDQWVSYYYAVVCRDASNNVGEPGVAAGSITNNARGIPTISLEPPATFAADGDLTEWFDSDIQPFIIGATTNSFGEPSIVGAVDSDDDLYATLYLAIDDEYLYIAADVIDDVYDGYQAGDGTGGWWENDVLELFIGFYDQRGAKHVGMMRGEQPDYKFYFLETHAVNDFNSQDTLAVNGDGNYYHEAFNPDYVLEARLALVDIAFDDDVLFDPANGMRIPIEPSFHDNDGAGWEGNLVCSPFNTDNAWQTPSVWSSTWIGNLSEQVAIDHNSGVVANEFELFPNYPNPFNPTTTISFKTPVTGDVKLTVYNMLGAQVDELINETLPMGYHHVVWNASSVSSGVYFYKLEAGGKVKTHKMILIK